MNKIAVCISGQMRSWEVQRGFFNSWNNEIDDVEFDFFISTWDTIGFDEIAIKPDKEISLDVTDEYIGKINGLKDYEILDEDGINWIDLQCSVTERNKKMAYLFCTCNLLKVKYEQENNFIYDSVISIRPDCSMILKQLRDRVISFLTLNEGLKSEWDKIYLELTPISKGGSVNYSDTNNGLYRNDFFSFGTSSTMDVYSNLFKYVFLNEEYNMIPHGHTMNHDYINYFALNELLPSFHITKARPNE